MRRLFLRPMHELGTGRAIENARKERDETAGHPGGTHHARSADGRRRTPPSDASPPERVRFQSLYWILKAIAHPDHLPARAGEGRGARTRPQARPRDPGVQPPIVSRLDLHPARRQSPRDVRCEGRVLRRRQDGMVLPRLRPDPDSPRRRQCERTSARRARPTCCTGRRLRYLPGGYAHARRLSAPRAHRCRAARAAQPGADHSDRNDRHRRSAADRPHDAEAVPAA